MSDRAYYATDRKELLRAGVEKYTGERGQLGLRSASGELPAGLHDWPRRVASIDMTLPLMATPWDQKDTILEIAADRTFESLLRRIREEDVAWVVVVRSHRESGDTYYYAFRPDELLEVDHPERMQWSVQLAMDMHEWESSPTVRGGRLVGPAVGKSGPAAVRTIEFDAGGRIVAVREHEAALEQFSARRPVATEARDVTEVDLGPLRGGGTSGGEVGLARAPREPTARPPALGGVIDVTLSAETKSEVDVGASAKVLFQIELTTEAIPLAVSQTARAKVDLPIIVSLAVENDAVWIASAKEFTVEPPQAGQPRTGFFTVKGVRPSLCRLAVAFLQGGSELGRIGLALEVVPTGASNEVTKRAAPAAPRDVADDDKLALLIEQRREGDQVFYEYTLHSEALGLPYRRLRSKPLLDPSGGPAPNALAFVERIYERVTKELKSLDDLKQLQREARALGASLCEELFDPEVAKVLWPLRGRMKLVQVVSWEPYIPWELVRLRDPASDEIDDRFLCEYGLVRTLSDDMPPRSLTMRRWAYLGATFPKDSFPQVGAELEYFTSSSPESLRGHGITPEPILATRDAFYDALAKGDFDVLHISCHADSPHKSIDRASLIIGDETVPGGNTVRLVEVDTLTVAAEARLSERRPLVFLNACETGRIGAVLTAWGGWPNVFLRNGAGAFVGTSWAVRDKPAAAFSTVFYNTLLTGETLAEAANAARAAAKKIGDASWLAFKVYGHPRAKRVSA